MGYVQVLLDMCFAYGQGVDYRIISPDKNVWATFSTRFFGYQN